MEFNLPLELWLKHVATNSRTKSKFPFPDYDYFNLYRTLKEKLNANIYSTINAALLQKHDPEDVNTPGVEIYTDHGLGHVNAVIKMAGHILGCVKASSKIDLEPYEVYLLLCCIACHDAGNIFGRNEHELNIRRVLIQPQISVLIDEDIQVIHRIARTHTGKQLLNRAYTNDTIQVLETSTQLSYQTSYRPRIIAAVLRFADEMSEDRRRVPKILINEPRVRDGGSGIYLLYASTIVNSSVDRESRSLRIDFELREDQILKKYKKFFAKKIDGKIVSFEEREIFLLEEIIDRLKKVNRERMYCNRSAEGVFTFSKLIASLKVLVPGNNDELIEHPLQQIEMSDIGYPSEDTSLEKNFAIWEAEKVHQEIKSRKGEA
jgi:hypothetical protein